MIMEEQRGGGENSLQNVFWKMLTLFKPGIWIDNVYHITTCPPPPQIFIPSYGPEHDHGRAKRRRRKFFPKSYSTWLNDDDEDETTADHSAIDHREAPPKQTTTQHDTLGLSDSLSFTVGTDRKFSLARSFSRTSTVRFSSNDRFFFYGRQNWFFFTLPMMMKMEPLPTIWPLTTKRHHQSKLLPKITL